jgi:hypothetical protein
MTNDAKAFQVKPFAVPSGIDVGPFNLQFCSPVADKLSRLDICGPNIELKVRDPNALLAEAFEAANACSPQCGVCHPDVCKPGAAPSGVCAPAVMSLGDLIQRVVNPIAERQHEIDRKIDGMMEAIRKIESRIKR